VAIHDIQDPSVGTRCPRDVYPLDQQSADDTLDVRRDIFQQEIVPFGQLSSGSADFEVKPISSY
jgi:hypothetical protein